MSANEALQRNEWAGKCFPESVDEIEHYSKLNPIKFALVSNKNGTRWDAPKDPNASCKGWTKIVAFCVVE